MSEQVVTSAGAVAVLGAFLLGLIGGVVLGAFGRAGVTARRRADDDPDEDDDGEWWKKGVAR